MEFVRIDLTRDDLLKSPYYYLQQNDVIYVSPNKVRAINSANVSLWLSTVSTIASAATVIVTIVNVSKKLEAMGADTICIKDMANLLLPYTAYDLVKAIKSAVRSVVVAIHKRVFHIVGQIQLAWCVFIIKSKLI